MAQEIINIGSVPNDGTGDALRVAYGKCNSNFSELYSRLQVQIPLTAVGSPGDLYGMVAFDDQWLYYCFQDYDGSSEIWRRIAGSSF